MKINPDDYVRLGTAAKIAGVTRAYMRRIITGPQKPDGTPKGIWLDGILIVRRDEAEAFAERRSPKKK